jgi:hypothetical protein
MPLALLLVIIDVMLVVHAAHTERAHPWHAAGETWA